jgi:signal transduction histidine kinase/Tfp pilus assembly protein PilF
MRVVLFVVFFFITASGFSATRPVDAVVSEYAEPTLAFSMQSFFDLFRSAKHTNVFKDWEGNINNKIEQEKYADALKLCNSMERAALASKSDYWLAVSFFYKGVCLKGLEKYPEALSLFLKIIDDKKSSLHEDEKKMFQVYRHIGGAYKHLNDFEKSLYYYKKSLEFDEKAKNIQTLISIYVSMGIMYSQQQEYAEAKECYIKGLQLIKDSDASMQSVVYNNLGNDEYAQGFYANAINYYIQSIQISEHLSDFEGLAFSYNNLGNIYADGINDLDKALVYYRKSLENEQKVNNKIGIAQCLNNIGYVNKLKQNYTEAEKMHIEALGIFRILKNTEGIAKALENLGDVYRKQNNYIKAISSFTECVEYRKQSKDEKSLASVYNNIGALYFTQKEYNKALSYFTLGFELAQKVNDKPLIKRFYSGIKDSYAKLGQYNKAYEYALLYSELKDTLLNATVSQQVIDIQEKYEKNKMQQQIVLQNLDIKNKALQRNAILAFLILSLLVFSGVVYFVLQKRKNEKLLYARNATIKDQEIKHLIQDSEIRAMASLAEGQDNERQRISRDLHDRVGSMLSLVKFNLSSGPEADNPIIKENLALLDQTYQEVRSISHNLHSGLLRNFGLKVALHDLKKTVEAHNSLRFNLQFYEEEFVLSKEKEEVVFRVLQELVTNALKYAEASFLDVQVNSADEGVVLITVEDDGKGFDTQTLKKGIGLSNIHYRLSGIGGSMEINSSPGKGAYFVISVPVEEEVKTVLS